MGLPKRGDHESGDSYSAPTVRWPFGAYGYQLNIPGSHENILPGVLYSPCLCRNRCRGFFLPDAHATRLARHLRFVRGALPSSRRSFRPPHAFVLILRLFCAPRHGLHNRSRRSLDRRACRHGYHAPGASLRLRGCLPRNEGGDHRLVRGGRDGNPGGHRSLHRPDPNPP